MLLCTFFAYNCPLLEFTDSRSARERCNARLLCSLSLSLSLLVLCVCSCFCCASSSSSSAVVKAVGQLRVRIRRIFRFKFSVFFSTRVFSFTARSKVFFSLSLSSRFSLSCGFVGCQIARGIESADPAYCFFFTCAVSFTAGGRTLCFFLRLSNSPPASRFSCFCCGSSSSSLSCEIGRGIASADPALFFFFPLKFVRFFYSNRAVSFTGGRT